MAAPLRRDADWVRQSFLVAEEDMLPVDSQLRTFSSVSMKYTDTTPGGNFAINPPPQFTRYADIRHPGRYSGNQQGPGKGMGRYYSEAIDDNGQLISMRFGVPQFNSLTTFFTGFYNTGAGQLARTGRAESAFYELGKAAGFVVQLMSWQLLAVHLLGVGFRFFAEKPSSKFYYLKPTMPLYWNAVTTIVNHIAVNRGIIPRVFGEDQVKFSGGYEFDDNGLEALHNLLPEIFRRKGGIDVYAMATRAQRLAIKNRKLIEIIENSGTLTQEKIRNRLAEIERVKLPDSRPDYDSYLKKWFKADYSKPKQGDGTSAEDMQIKEVLNKDPGFWDFMRAELDEGSQFVTFRVNATGPISESFSNTVTESELSSKMNSMSSSARSTNFSFAQGNLVGGALGALVGGVTNAVKDFASGAMDSLQISGLAAVGGAAFVDIPKHWQSSQASLPRSSYTINLVSPYGNPISQLTNIYIPLAMLLAAALPLSTGKQSYTSPFILELFDQGRCQTRLGMIDSLSISRGTGNLGFNVDKVAMGVEVTFSIVDMSSVMHMPIAEGFSLTQAITTAGAAIAGGAGTAAISAGIGTAAGGGAAVAGGVGVIGGALGTALGAAGGAGIFDDETVFSDYMAVLAGVSLADQIYPTRKLKLNLTRAMANWDSWLSKSHAAVFWGDSWPTRLVSLWFQGTDRGAQTVQQNIGQF